MAHVTPSPQNPQSLLATGGRLYQALTEWSADLGPSTKEDAKKLAQSLRRLTGLLQGLHSGDPKAAIEEARGLWSKLPANAPLEEIQAKVSAALKDTIHAAERSEAYKTIQQAMRGVTEKLTEHHAGTPLLERVGEAFTKHQEWLEKRSAGGRMCYGAGCIAVGSVITHVGGQWLWQAMSGSREEHYQPAIQQDPQRRATIVISKPLPATERVLKGVLGAGGLAIGVAGTGFGIYNILHSPH